MTSDEISSAEVSDLLAIPDVPISNECLTEDCGILVTRRWVDIKGLSFDIPIVKF